MNTNAFIFQKFWKRVAFFYFHYNAIKCLPKYVPRVIFFDGSNK